MPASTRLEAVIFDLDGTLIDSAPTITATLARLLDEHGCPALTLETVTRLVGDGGRTLVARAFHAVGLPVDDAGLDRLARRYAELLAEHPPGPEVLFPGVPEALAGLADRGIALGVCSNKPARAIAGTLESTGLAPFFAVALGGDSLPERKPDPAPLLETIRRLGRRPRRSVMVGDSENDAMTAQAAGVPFVGVSFGYARVPLSELPVDRIIDAFDELPKALEGMGDNG